MIEAFDFSVFVHWLSWLFIAIGSFFVLVGAIGLLRMPDMFTRMHAASVSDSVGAGFLIAGMMVQAGLTLVTVKLAFIMLLLAFTSPVATHALAQAAMHAGLLPRLKEDRRGRSLDVTAASSVTARTIPGIDVNAGPVSTGTQNLEGKPSS